MELKVQCIEIKMRYTIWLEILNDTKKGSLFLLFKLISLTYRAKP